MNNHFYGQRFGIKIVLAAFTLTLLISALNRQWLVGWQPQLLALLIYLVVLASIDSLSNEKQVLGLAVIDSVMFLFLALLLLFVVPRFYRVFGEMNMRLPVFAAVLARFCPWFAALCIAAAVLSIGIRRGAHLLAVRITYKVLLGIALVLTLTLISSLFLNPGMSSIVP